MTERSKFLITIQAWVNVEHAAEADNIAVRVANYAEESNEDPEAEPTSIQTCVAQKAPFKPLGQDFWTGESVEADIEKERA